MCEPLLIYFTIGDSKVTEVLCQARSITGVDDKLVMHLCKISLSDNKLHPGTLYSGDLKSYQKA